MSTSPDPLSRDGCFLHASADEGGDAPCWAHLFEDAVTIDDRTDIDDVDGRKTAAAMQRLLDGEFAAGADATQLTWRHRAGA